MNKWFPFHKPRPDRLKIGTMHSYLRFHIEDNKNSNNDNHNNNNHNNDNHNIAFLPAVPHQKQRQVDLAFSLPLIFVQIRNPSKPSFEAQEDSDSATRAMFKYMYYI